MPQNLVSLDISADQIAARDQAIATYETRQAANMPWFAKGTGLAAA